MSIALEMYQIQNLMADANETGAMRALIETGNLKPFLSKSEADRQYGRGTVDRWIKEGLITPGKDGGASSKIRLDRMQLRYL